MSLHVFLGLTWNALAIACITSALYFFLRAWQIRRYMHMLQRQGLPMPTHSLIFGHLGIVAELQKSLPPDAHGHYLADLIRQKYPDLGPSFYLDLWPFSDPMLIVTDPELVAQFSAPDRLLPKHPGVKTFLDPITGGYDLNCLDGETWKFWRKLFNPGFSTTHIQSLVPTIVDEVMIFRRNLLHRANEGKLFLFEESCLSVTIDIIGRVALGSKLNTQQGPNPWISALLNQRRWCAFGLEMGIGILMNPLRYVHIWNNRNIMDKHIDRDLDARYSLTRGETQSKSIIDLALKGYRTQKGGSNVEVIDATFRRYARSQLKVFIFAGHDAASTTICYCWLLLSRNPRAMENLRAEHDSVLSADRDRAAEVLSQDPALLNNLPYTLAVIKETLRLFPVVSSARGGLQNYTLTDSDGRRFPTERCLVWAVHHGIHHNPSWWARVEDFLPERFLPEHQRPEELRPMRHAWRPFELGPRACIGVELAMAELKIVLALTARDFDLEEGYAEWDKLHPQKLNKIQTVNGERAYQIQMGSAHPVNGFPVRLSIRE